MEPAAAAEVLRRALRDPTRPMTVADASAASGLPLRDAEAGLHFLTSEYRGHLRVTEDGDLVHVFPNGFTKPWQTRETTSRVLGAVGRVLLGAGRFVVRAWLLIVMVAYALIFLALLVGLTFARSGGSSDRDDSRGAGGWVIAALFRAIADALFWTFHPLSPLYLPTAYEDVSRGRRARVERRDPNQEVPFYEKVNRFVFGPPAPPIDPNAMRARVVAEIRALKGRIGLADVMRVTGLPRDQADPLMARLMLDYDGTVDVGESGGIVYRFEALRRTAGETVEPRPPPAWQQPARVPPLTGNTAAANLGIALLNGFNLIASGWVLAQGLTISNIALLFSRHPPAVLPDDGIPIALGLVPFVFSVAISALPMARALLRLREHKKVARTNARLAVLREVLQRAPKKEPVPDEALRAAWRQAAGEEPSSKEISLRVAQLGGDVDVGPDGQVRYRFADLEEEAAALEEERERASEAEARIGKIVFASDR
jgi:hypothetical protein